MIPKSIDPRDFQPAAGRLGELNIEAIRELLKTLKIGDANESELANYASEDCERFMQTIHLLPNGVEDVLEIGASPYFTTVLARWFRPDLKFQLTNFFGSGKPHSVSTDHISVQSPNTNREEFQLNYKNINVETTALDLDDESVDVVLFCEVLEHMTNDPLFPLLEFWRVLKPGGYLVLTTPNVARLENVARLMAGHNLYDPYSAYGAYGRHNREYTRHELFALLSHCGFSVETFFSADVTTNRAGDYYPNLDKIADLLVHRNGDLGQYQFTRWRKSDRAKPLKPSWLYRSYPADLTDATPL